MNVILFSAIYTAVTVLHLCNRLQRLKPIKISYFFSFQCPISCLPLCGFFAREPIRHLEVIFHISDKTILVKFRERCSSKNEKSKGVNRCLGNLSRMSWFVSRFFVFLVFIRTCKMFHPRWVSDSKKGQKNIKNEKKCVLWYIFFVLTTVRLRHDCKIPSAVFYPFRLPLYDLVERNVSETSCIYLHINSKIISNAYSKRYWISTMQREIMNLR